MKRIILIAALLTISSAVNNIFAIRAYPLPISVRQPDGTTITIQIHGDEFLNWTTAGNRLVEKGTDGFYYYASFNPDGTKSISKTRASSGSLASFAASVSENNTVQPPQAAIAAAQAKRAIAKIGNTDLASGRHQFLVMLIEFADLQFTIPNPQTQFSRLLNEVGYSENGGTGSSYDYYYENSGGQFEPTFDIIGPVRVEGNHAEYGENRGTTQAAFLLAEACRIANQQGLVDFSRYDQDNDGTVDNIFFFFAGGNAAEGAGNDCIWPHQWELYEPYVGKLEFNGVSLNTSYACTSEYNFKGIMSGIGTFTHEFGHVIGLPDLYDTDNEQNGLAPGIGTLSLMDQGSYNNDGRTPPYLSGYERAMLGWLELEEWTEPGIKTLAPVQDNVAFMTTCDTDGEFYVYEYRNGEGNDRYIEASGVLIYHVDRSSRYSARWESNLINAYSNHQCYDLVESVYPERYATTNSDKVFPGSTENKVFSSTSRPAAVDWNGNPLKFNLYNITDNGTSATLMLSAIEGGSSIPDFADEGINAINRKNTYSSGETFSFLLNLSNHVPTEVTWLFDGEEHENGSSIELTSGEHTVQAVLTYSDGSTETITTRLNVQ